MSLLHTLFDAILSKLNTTQPSRAAFGTEENKYEYYAFISYKHEENGRFANDAAWAKALERELIRLHIPTGISEEERIASTDDSVNPIFRDGSILSTIRKGLLPNMLEQKLRGSKTLVLILSQQMIEDQNNKYNPDPRKNQAWIYWEVKTFLKYHNYDWTRVIPIYVDPQDYLPSNLSTSIKVESNYDNIEKPWHDYKQEYNWDTQKTELYRRTAAAVASSIFRAEKDAFWNLKEKEREVIEAEKRKNHIQKILWVIISLFAFTVALFGLAMMMKNQSANYFEKAKAELSKGNRQMASVLANDALHTWKWTKGIPELLWTAMDSTSSLIRVNSRVFIDEDRKQISYIEKNRDVVFLDMATMREVERVDLKAVKDFAISGDGNTIVGFRPNETVIYYRDEKKCEAFTKEPDYTHEVRINESGSVVVFPNTFFTATVHFKGDGNTCESLGLRKFDDGFDYRDVTKFECSFVSSDSLFVRSYVYASGSNTKGILAFNHLSPHQNGKINNNLITIKIPGNIRNSFLSPVSSDLYVQTTDSLIRYKIGFSELQGPVLNRENAVPTDLNIREIRFRKGLQNVLLIDEDGVGYACVNMWKGSETARIGESEGFLKSRLGQTPIMLDWNEFGIEGYYILNYTPNGDYINIKDPRRGFHIPPTLDGDVIRGVAFDGVTILTISHREYAWQYCNYTSYIFTRGDKRKFSFYGYNAHFLSPDYVVHNSFHLFHHDNVLDRSAALFSLPSNSFVLDISQPEDKSIDLVNPIAFALGKHYLAALVCYSDKKSAIRIYSLEEKCMVNETSVDNRNVVQLYGWKDDVLLYSNRDGLRKIALGVDGVFKDSHMADIYNYNLICEEDRSTLQFELSGWPRKKGWYNSYTGEITVLEQEEEAVVNKRGSLYASIFAEKGQIVFVNPESKDIVGVVRSENVISGIGDFNLDDKYFVYSTEDGMLKCVSMSSLKEKWSHPIWKPVSYALGKKYGVFVSSSIYVINLATGGIVSSFEYYPMKQTTLHLSKDERYLICNRSLYDLKTGQLLSSRLPDRTVKSIEKGYIVYDDQLLRLPEMAMLLTEQ